MSHRETIDLQVKHCNWRCTSCGNVQSEYPPIKADDLTCQHCGANFTRGKFLNNRIPPAKLSVVHVLGRGAQLAVVMSGKED